MGALVKSALFPLGELERETETDQAAAREFRRGFPEKRALVEQPTQPGRPFLGCFFWMSKRNNNSLLGQAEKNNQKLDKEEEKKVNSFIMTMENLKQRISKFPPENRWTIHLFESIMTQRPPDQGDDYTPEKLEAEYRQDMQKCFELGLSREDLRLLVDAEKLPSNRWDKEIVIRLLKEE